MDNTGGHRVLDVPLMAFDLTAEMEKLKAGAQWAHSRRAAITLIKSADLRIVLVLLARGIVIHEHQAEGPITVSAEAGSIRFRAGGEERILARGSLLTLHGRIPHEIEALEDESAFVVTVVQPHHEA